MIRKTVLALVVVALAVSLVAAADKAQHAADAAMSELSSRRRGLAIATLVILGFLLTLAGPGDVTQVAPGFRPRAIAIRRARIELDG